MTAPESREAVEIVPLSARDAEFLDAARYVRETWALVVEREKARVEALRQSRVIPHERGEE